MKVDGKSNNHGSALCFVGAQPQGAVVTLWNSGRWQRGGGGGIQLESRGDYVLALKRQPKGNSANKKIGLNGEARNSRGEYGYHGTTGHHRR